MPSSQTYFPPASYDEALAKASERWGVQPDYWDIFGNHHFTSAEVQKTILQSLGVDASSLASLTSALEEAAWQEWSLPVPRTLVITASSPTIPIQVPAEQFSLQVRARFLWENGTSNDISVESSILRETGSAEIRSRQFSRRLLPLPANSPLGYHRITLTLFSAGREIASAEGRLILCPEQAWKPAKIAKGGKGAGIAISLYGLRSDRNWGCGDFTDLHAFTTWAAEDLSVSFVALNPLHSIPNRQPYNTSPYLPNSSYYRNPIYIDVEQVEDIKASPWAQSLLRSAPVQEKVRALREAPYVEYEQVFELKLRVLQLGYRQLRRSKGDRLARFRAWAAAEGDLLHVFSLYCALDRTLHKRDRNLWIWPDWPAEYQQPEGPAISEFTAAHPRLIEFFQYLQWITDQQLASAQAHAKKLGMAVGLYHDLALATDRCGSDLWAHRPFYVAGCRVGSPPDDFSPAGQDWAFPPPNSIRHREDGYRHFAESITKNAKHGGALRIDHVMRFFRLFWIPDGADARSGVYVRDFAEDLLRILALESVRNQVLIIGEDLGTVEPYIREALAQHGILSYRLLYFEKRKDGNFKVSEEYPRQALVSVSTHDLPTLAGFWTGRDVRARHEAGILDQNAMHAQLRDREGEKQKLLNLFFSQNLLPSWFSRDARQIAEFSGELHNAAVGFLALTPSELMVLNQEDLFKETDQQNLPGTTEQYPNWRHKMRHRIEELRTDEEARGCTAMFRSWLQQSHREN